MLREIQLGVDCHVPIVRLRIEDIPLSDDLRYYLSTPQYLDALTTPLSRHIPRVEAAIRELLEQSGEETGNNPLVEAPPVSEVAPKNRALDLPRSRGEKEAIRDRGSDRGRGRPRGLGALAGEAA